jgi:acyl dehydratase
MALSATAARRARLHGLEWKFLAPARVGDTIRCVSRSLAKRLMKDAGVVVEERSILNQRDELVQQGKITLLVAKRPVGDEARGGDSAGEITP